MPELPDVADTAARVRAPAGAPGTDDANLPRMRLVDVLSQTKVRLDDGRLVVASGIVIQGASFVRPVLDGDGRLGSMEVLHGHQLVMAG